jgi:adenylosuccinate lyase
MGVQYATETVLATSVEKEPSLTRSLQDQLFALSAIDGRYRSKLENLAPLLSEAGLMSFRIRVEAEWILHLVDHPALPGEFELTPAVRERLEQLASQVPDSALLRIKELERTTNHDVKAVEYYLRETLAEAGANQKILAFIHFACTSEDINNLSYGLMLHETRQKVVLPTMDRIVSQLEEMALRYKNLPMLSRTHGQTASPTTLGKEMAVFAHRLWKQRQKLAAVALEGKMSGAVGNYNAHLAAYPDVDWVYLTQGFIEKRLGLKQNLLTTQIENHDSMVEYAEHIKRFNTILIGLCRDIWSYISIEYFKQQAKAGEIGSSTMPHKINPIDFENAEGNLGVANSLATHYSDKLLISRWQRDLTDSTVQRTLGTFIGHTVLAYESFLKGLSKITPHEPTLATDLEQSWEVMAEAIQTCMRRYEITDAYERLKNATRGQKVEAAALQKLIRECPELPDAVQERLLAMTPADYVGCAATLVDRFVQERRDADQ